jgi:hypothetical protein
MEIFAGRSVSKLTWGATLAALSAMGLLEWEGANVHDVLVPCMGDTWPLLGCALSAAHIFRSESLSARFDPLHLTAVQVGVHNPTQLSVPVVRLESRMLFLLISSVRVLEERMCRCRSPPKFVPQAVPVLVVNVSCSHTGFRLHRCIEDDVLSWLNYTPFPH